MLIEKQQENIAIYNPEECTLYAEGKLNLGEDAGLLEIDAFGALFSDFTEQTIGGKVDLSFDFLIHRKAAKMITKALKKSSLEEKVDESSALHQRLLEEQLGKRKLRKYNRKKRKGRRFLPDELDHTFYFPQLRLDWNKKSASFISPKKVSLSNINGRKVDRMVPGCSGSTPALFGRRNQYLYSNHFR